MQDALNDLFGIKDLLFAKEQKDKKFIINYTIFQFSKASHIIGPECKRLHEI